MQAIDVINLNPTTREQAVMFVEKICAEIEGGNINPLELHIKLTAMQRAIDDIKKKIADRALTEAYTHNQKLFETKGAKVEISELGVKYDYAACGDSEWERIDSQIFALTESRKKRETFLKALQKPEVIANQETGEMETIQPPKKTSTTGLKITLL